MGTYSSIELGTISNTVYTTFAPTDLSFRIPDEGLNTISSTLSFTVKSTYGSPFAQSFEVKQLSEKIKPDTEYLTSDSLITNSVVVGTFQTTTSLPSEINIDINTSIGEYILQQGNVAFTTAEVFSDLFNGLAIVPTNNNTSNNGSVYSIDVATIQLTINYSGKTTGTNYSLIFQPISSSRTAYYCKKDRSNSSVQNSLNNSTAGNNTFYLQGISAISSKITIPGIKKWFTSDNNIINKATLTLKPNQSNNSNYTLPTTLTCHLENTATSEGIQATYDASSNSYAFEIQTLLSEALMSEEEIRFNISVLNSNTHPEQISISGNNDTIQPASLKILYTKY